MAQTLLMYPYMKTPIKILFVEDDPEMNAVYGENFIHPEFETSTASDGREALEVLLHSGSQFDVVVTDNQMPEMDGLSLLRVISRTLPDTNVIMVTGYGNSGDYVDAYNAGVINFLDKPVKMADLKRLIRSLVQTRKEVGMPIFKKILCPLDFSEYSTLALRYAAAIARENEASLALCHSIPDLSPAMSYLDGRFVSTVDETLISSATAKLDQFAADVVLPNQRVLKTIERGDPCDAILKNARETGADLIVMGTHGHTGYEQYFVGSVTNKVLHKSALPVLVVCRQSHHFIRENGSRGVEIKKILCPLDFECNSREIAKLALAIARTYQSQITFLNVVPKADSEHWEAQQETAVMKLKGFVDPVKEDWCSVRFHVRPGRPDEEILKTIEENQMDLVVLGHHSRTPAEELFLGSVARRVVTDSSCPVLVARSSMDVLAAMQK